MGGDPTGNDRDNDYRSPNLPDDIAGPVAAQPYTVNGKVRTPVLNEKGEQVGYMGDPVLPSLGNGCY